MGQILTGGPLSPLSPFSHAHLLWARGHYKQRLKVKEESDRCHREDKCGNLQSQCHLRTYSFISQGRLQNKNRRKTGQWLELVKMKMKVEVRPHQDTLSSHALQSYPLFASHLPYYLNAFLPSYCTYLLDILLIFLHSYYLST